MEPAPAPAAESSAPVADPMAAEPPAAPAAEVDETKAAVVVQSASRGALARKRQKEEAARNADAAEKIQAHFKGHKARADPAAEANVRKERAAQDPVAKAQEYIDRHKLRTLFEQLAQALVYAKPDDPKAFLVSKLQALRDVKDVSSPLHFFSADEVDIVYSMYAGKGDGGLSRAQCAEALNAIGVEHRPQFGPSTRVIYKPQFRAMALGDDTATAS